MQEFFGENSEQAAAFANHKQLALNLKRDSVAKVPKKKKPQVRNKAHCLIGSKLFFLACFAQAISVASSASSVPQEQAEQEIPFEVHPRTLDFGASSCTPPQDMEENFTHTSAVASVSVRLLSIDYQPTCMFTVSQLSLWRARSLAAACRDGAP